jgi:hypothetical protein
LRHHGCDDDLVPLRRHVVRGGRERAREGDFDLASAHFLLGSVVVSLYFELALAAKLVTQKVARD